jgi:hypothetical protein
MLNLAGMPTAVSLYQHDPVAGSTIYLTVRTAANAMNAGALFAAGWAVMLAGCAALATHELRTPLGWLMIAAGFGMIFSFALLPVGLLGVLLAPVWSIWLGVALLRGPGDPRGARLLAPQT